MTNSEHDIYEFDVENDIITIVVHGKRDTGAVQQAAENVVAYKNYVAGPTEGRSIIVDFRKAGAISDVTIQTIVAAHKQMNFQAMAYVRHNNWQRAFLQTVIANAESPGKYHTFTDLEDARAWLISLKQ